LKFGLFWLLLLGAGYQLRGDVLYNVTELGNLGGASSTTYATAINNAGQVTGVSDGHAFLHSNGQMQDLGTLGGGDYSKGGSINDAGQITGFSISPHGTDEHAFVYSDRQMQDLGTLGGSSSAGYAINNAGHVTGSSDISGGSGHAFLYSNGQMTDLGPGEGAGINDQGQIVGTDAAAGFIYSNGQRQVVGALPGEIRGGPIAINNAAR
jgi:probable HAF family extracellular repeat protein